LAQSGHPDALNQCPLSGVERTWAELSAQRYPGFGRRLSMARAVQSFNPSLPRLGRIEKQCRRCLLINDGAATMRQLADYCYPCRPRQHWFYINIKRALRRLGAGAIGRSSTGRGRPGIWQLSVRQTDGLGQKD
jgi:hypothetical protein